MADGKDRTVLKSVGFKGGSEFSRAVGRTGVEAETPVVPSDLNSLKISRIELTSSRLAIFRRQISIKCRGMRDHLIPRSAC